MASNPILERCLSMRKSRLIHFILLAALALSTLTACGGKGVENLEATCNILREKMKPFEDIALLSRNLYYDGDSVAMLLGDETRADNKRFIYQSFPFMKSYTIDGIQNGEYEKGLKNYKIQTAIHIFESTPNPIVLTEKEKEAIETSDDPYTEIIEPKVLRVIGEAYSDEGCVGLDDINEVDYTYLIDGLYDDTQSAAEESVSHLLGILLCERDGKIDDTKCDTEDFKDTYVYTPSNELTEEEKEILAERERDAQSESQGSSESSGTSNVTPLQLCSSLGAVVQTENYGQLTCKLVWLNRIRTLVWMR